ncbi:uncharacterized protein LOC112575716 [Pomacea canaliculata]|uniref:uncharacterized protein LOC112575716 n=1 Tax=Pomacea canaliculata TaxID=400727 RepID=UPI000D735EC9|nr:uncharacterized protein LOC112575716 [Pomacea canaliculata]
MLRVFKVIQYFSSKRANPSPRHRYSWFPVEPAEKLQQVKQRQESLEQNTEKLKDHVDQSLQVFENKLDKLEGFSRRDNLRFFGIPETGDDSYETCAATIIQLLQETIPGKVWQTTDIVRAHRVGKKIVPAGHTRNRENKPRPIIAKFTRWSDKLDILTKAREKLRVKGVTVASDLTERQQSIIKCYRDSGVRAFYRGDRLIVGGTLHQNMNRQQDEREKPRTNADSSPSQHQTTLQQQTDEYTLVTAQRNKGVRQHRSSQSYLPLPLRNRYLPLQAEDEEEDINRLQADKHGKQTDTNAATYRGATAENRHTKRIQCTPTTIIQALGNISNNPQMTPTAILPTICSSESNITNISTGDNTKEKDTPPYTSVIEVNNSQTADVSESPPDSNVQVSSPHPTSVSPDSRDPETI